MPKLVILLRPKTKLGDGAKANHLAYLGDANIGDKTNVGAGPLRATTTERINIKPL